MVAQSPLIPSLVPQAFLFFVGGRKERTAKREEGLVKLITFTSTTHFLGQVGGYLDHAYNLQISSRKACSTGTGASCCRMHGVLCYVWIMSAMAGSDCLQLQGGGGEKFSTLTFNLFKLHDPPLPPPTRSNS